MHGLVQIYILKILMTATVGIQQIEICNLWDVPGQLVRSELHARVSGSPGSTVPASQNETKHCPKQNQESKNRRGLSIRNMIQNFSILNSFVLQGAYVGFY